MVDAPVLLLTKKDIWSQKAATFAHNLFKDRLIVESGSGGDADPKSFLLPRFAAVISFLSPWIIPGSVLSKTALSLNFHPGSCDYPGIGCYNFAIYENAKEFGPVCHHMLPKVDSGEVVAERLFAVARDERVETLKLRTMQTMLALFEEIMPIVAQGGELPVSMRQWQRKPFTRKELNALCEVIPQMSEDEKARRIRATTYPGYPGPYLLLENGEKRPYPVPPGPALA